MAYVNNLLTYTSQTTPASDYAPPPAVVCNFGWYDTLEAQTYGTLIYDVAGNIYPPPDAGRQWPNHSTIDYVTLIGAEVTFDALNSLNITTTINSVVYPLDSCIVPSGYQIIDYAWDFGNGQIAQGPVASTTYTQPTPDGACTLTVTDNLGRVTSTTRRLNFVVLTPIAPDSSGRMVGVKGTGGSGQRGAFVYDFEGTVEA